MHACRVWKKQLCYRGQYNKCPLIIHHSILKTDVIFKKCPWLFLYLYWVLFWHCKPQVNLYGFFIRWVKTWKNWTQFSNVHIFVYFWIKEWNCLHQSLNNHVVWVYQLTFAPHRTYTKKHFPKQIGLMENWLWLLGLIESLILEFRFRCAFLKVF